MKLHLCSQTRTHVHKLEKDMCMSVCLSVCTIIDIRKNKHELGIKQLLGCCLAGRSVSYVTTLLQLPLYAASSSVAAGPASVACCTCNRNTTIISGTDVTLALDVLRLLSCSQLSSLWLFEKFVCLPCAMLHSGVN